MEVSIAKRPLSTYLWPEPPGRFFKSYSNLPGGYYRFHWRACAEVIAEHVKDFVIVHCPHFEEKKSDRETKS